MIAASAPSSRERANRWTTTSVSLLVWKMAPCADQRVAQLAGVHQVAVVADRELAVHAVDDDRLRVGRPCSRRRSSSGRGRWPGARAASQRLGVERLVDVAHRLRVADLDAVGRGDAGALLPAMLQRVQPEVGEVRGLGVAEDPEDAALVLELVEHRAPSVYGLTQSPCGSKYRPIAVDQIRSASASGSSIDRDVRRSRCGSGRRRRGRSRAAGTPARSRQRQQLGRTIRRHRHDDARRRFAEQRRDVAERRRARPRRQRRRRRRPSPVSKQHSASVTAKPPSAQSCADRIRPARRAGDEQPLQRRLALRGRAPAARRE